MKLRAVYGLLKLTLWNVQQKFIDVLKRFFSGIIVHICSSVSPGGRDDDGDEGEHGAHRQNPPAAWRGHLEVQRVAWKGVANWEQVSAVWQQLSERLRKIVSYKN